jgi:hypothetical protein
MLVHFPVSLSPVALLFAGLAIWRFPALGTAARLLVYLGTVSSIVMPLVPPSAEGSDWFHSFQLIESPTRDNTRPSYRRAPAAFGKSLS